MGGGCGDSGQVGHVDGGRRADRSRLPGGRHQRGSHLKVPLDLT
jgi:hypothetical protein